MSFKIIGSKYLLLVLILLFSGEFLLAQSSSPLIINEFSASNNKVLLDEDGESSDWIEIYNTSKETVQLSGWALTDDSLSMKKWLFPAIEINAGQFIVVFASTKDRRIAGHELHTNFRLESSGEYLALVNNAGEAVSEFKPTFEKQYQDISYGRRQQKDTTLLISSANSGKMRLPTQSDWNQIQYTWTGSAANEPFDEADWTPVNTAFGFDMRNSSTAEQNLALGKPATQSSGYNGDQFPATLATDGNGSNFTHTGDDDFSPWWETDLGKQFFIDKVILYNRTSCCQDRLYNITVEVFDNSGNSVFESPVLNPSTVGENPSSPGDHIEYNFNDLPSGGVSGQKVRIKKTSVSGVREYLSLAEVEIFGVETYHGSITSEIPEMQGTSSIALVRFPFQVDDTLNVDFLQLKMKYDDGFIAFINGHEIASANKPEGTLEANSTAVQAHMGNFFEAFSIPTTVLNQGKNILAIVGLNVTADDPSFLIHPELSAYNVEPAGLGFFPVPTPGSINNEGVEGFVADTKFDIDRGFFSEAFQVTVMAETPGASIIYTTDSSEPTLQNGTVVPALSPQTFPFAKIDITTTTVLRAAAFKNGLQSTNTDTHSYLFLDDVIASEVMDKTITEDPRYKPHMKKSLSNIPTMSLVITPGTIEDEVDQSASLEWIIPGSEDGFQENCGVRYYGGEWAGPFAKQNFRVYFRSRYGASKLKYPLFDGFEYGIPTVDKFDQLEIRAGSHDMVQRGFYMSNRFGDDTMLEMGNLNTHGRFIHLYFNGVYWGMYHLRERFNADWLAQYKGGNKDDYEAISGNKNVGGWTQDDRVYDGDGTAWETAKSLREDYESIKEYVDLQNYIDFMLLYMFGNSENEYRCAGSKTPGVGFQFQLNDADGYLRNTGNRTTMGQPGQKHADGPGSIFSMLLKEGHPAYKILLADRIHKHFFNNGALTPYSITDRLGKRCNEVAIPFYAEAARWDYRTPQSWEDAKNDYLANVAPYRTAAVIQHFKDAGFYPDLDAPLFFVNNEEHYGGQFIKGDLLSMFRNNGNIYYTLDGSDPYNPVKTDNQPQTLVEANASKSALILSSAIPDNWNKIDFDDSGWLKGQSGVGYETGSGYEEEIGIDVSSMHNEYTGCLIRIPFQLYEDLKDKATQLILKIKYDDGFVAYLNGKEVKRVNLEGAPAWNSKSDGLNEANGFIDFDISAFTDSLKTGANVLAFHGLNTSAGSSDFIISAQLEVQFSNQLEEQLTGNAILYNEASLTLDTTVVVSARTYQDGIWSALSQATFTKNINVGIEEPVVAQNTLFDIINYPNPFTDKTSLRFRAAIDSEVEINIFNVLGEKVWNDISTVYAGESKTFQINTQNWNKGIFLYQLKTRDGKQFTGKMVHNR